MEPRCIQHEYGMRLSFDCAAGNPGGFSALNRHALPHHEPARRKAFAFYAIWRRTVKHATEINRNWWLITKTWSGNRRTIRIAAIPILSFSFTLSDHTGNSEGEHHESSDRTERASGTLIDPAEQKPPDLLPHEVCAHRGWKIPSGGAQADWLTADSSADAGRPFVDV